MDSEDLLALQERYRLNNKQRRKHSIKGVLQNIQKEKLFSTIINDFRKVNTKLQLESRKLTLDLNYSTQLMRNRKSKNKSSQLQRESKWLSGQGSPALDGSPEQKQHTQTNSVSKRSISSKRKSSVQLPSLLNFTISRCPEINSKDKLIQHIFLKMAKSSDFIYNVTMTKKMLLDFISKEYTRKFANYLSWFFDLRSTIDYKYYIEMGNKLLELTPSEIAHFVYSAFDGFALDSCFEFFRENFGLKDVLYVTRMRQTLKTCEEPIFFDKMNYNKLKNVSKRDNKLTDCSPKMDTVYRKTFLHNDLHSNMTESIERAKLGGRVRRKGQISFEQFCSLYNNKVPNFYIDMLFRLYFIEVVEGEIDEPFKQKYIESLESVAPTESNPQKNPPAASKLLETLQNAKKRRDSLKLYRQEY